MSRLAFTLAFALAFIGSETAFAQSIEDRLRDQLRQTTLQLREVQDGQAALQAQKTAAEQERDALKRQVTSLQAEVVQAKRGGGEADALKQEVGKYRDALAQASQIAQQTQAERDKLHAAVTNKDASLTACEQKNADLLKVSREIVAKFEAMGAGDAVGLSEPFIQSSRVRLENMAQDYGDRIYDGQFDARMVKPRPAQSSNTPGQLPPANGQSGLQQSSSPQAKAPAMQPQK